MTEDDKALLLALLFIGAVVFVMVWTAFAYGWQPPQVIWP